MFLEINFVKISYTYMWHDLSFSSNKNNLFIEQALVFLLLSELILPLEPVPGISFPGGVNFIRKHHVVPLFFYLLQPLNQKSIIFSSDIKFKHSKKISVFYNF